MAYLEEIELSEDSFSKAICSSKNPLEGVESQDDAPFGDHTIPIQSSGMYEMAPYFDSARGYLADSLIDAIGPLDGENFLDFQERMKLLHDRNRRELDRNNKN